MSTTTTIGRWLDIAAARASKNQPLGAGLMQMMASNATHAARENEIRPLWEHPGDANIYADLPLGGVPFFDWDTESSAGRFTAFCGIHRARRYGETIKFPRLELRYRGLAPSTYDLGVILLAMPGPGQPSTSGVYDTLITSATSLTACKITLDLSALNVGSSLIAPRTGTGAITTLPESGRVPSVAVYVGAWCTSGSGGAKAEMRGMTLFLREPL
jgi:hypothetical protein